MTQDEQKHAAAEAAVELVTPGMTLGLGSGTTAARFIRALAARRIDVRGVATSDQTASLARLMKIEVVDLDHTHGLDLVIDGADEIAPDLSLIKGGGAALLREKLVWLAARRRVVIADQSKCVKTLGAFPLPVEVVAFAHASTATRISTALMALSIAATPSLRVENGEAVRTDSGNLIYDFECGAIADPAALATALKALTGVVEHGLFLGLADMALIGGDNGVATVERGGG